MIRKTYRVLSNGKSNNDDGGSAKGSHRLYRRKRRRMMKLLKLLSICVCIVMFMLFGNRFFDNFSSTRNPNSYSANSEQNEFNMKSSESTRNVPRFRWTKDSILPPLRGDMKAWTRKYLSPKYKTDTSMFKTTHTETLPWESSIKSETYSHKDPFVDYTKHEYIYPELISSPPRGGSYPPFDTLGNILAKWPQNDIDTPPVPFVERLQHFDFNDPVQMEAALRYREAQFPFKLTHVPEIITAGAIWTDEYLIQNFDGKSGHFDRRSRLRDEQEKNSDTDRVLPPMSNGHCEESVDSFFAFFNSRFWNINSMGDPPTLDNGFSFGRWSNHAKYADTIRLNPHETHYYWQAGASEIELKGPKEKWSMIPRDLPSFSDRNPNFISSNPDERKGIQCRFGERGIAAATHYDGGKNMVGMITGAKRYILAPPIECEKLGIVTNKKHPIFRHSLLNFDHINILETEESNAMPHNEREWLELSRNSLAIDTVLKAGEILYIPSHWFHYIISLQKSAQCNVRSGRDFVGSVEWGSVTDVNQCVGDETDI